jgi:GNAT superfamily N-acetyltransferase
MARRSAPLTVDRLDGLPAPCRTCLFWELDPVRRARFCTKDAIGQKQSWVSEVLREWGSCGRIALLDDKPVGHVIYAPAYYVPGADSIPTAPASADAVVMTTLYVDPGHRRAGIGRLLIQLMARDLAQRGGIRAIEVFARHGHPGLGPESGLQCIVPAEFCLRVGFKTQRAHPAQPRLRMDLRTALTWRDEVGQAVGKLLEVVGPIVAPAPKASRPPARRTRSAS